MHNFSELVYRSTAFSLGALQEAESKVLEQLQTSRSTILVKNFQMIQLQKAIIAIGIFSLFESILQDGLACENGFKEAKKNISQSNIDLINRFGIFISAINILKHAKGRSYEALVAKSTSLPFRIKLPGEDFFNESDMSEISTLSEVNNAFVLDCAKLIEEVSKEIGKSHSGFFS